MKQKKKVFIISHSHWDREWYMSFEEHHMRLINLIDDLLYLFKNDPDFDSFHLDGQDIILDDYLAVRPEKRAEIKHWVEAGKLRVGPFYILQDDFLISPESNVRNTQYGMKKAKNYGHAPVPVGYFPDTFGNMGQAPQLMKLSHLDTVAFGRGVTPTGFNNQVSQGDFDSTYSEMYWQSPNKDQVLGILFANWYSNANEIPVDEKEAKEFWTKKLADAEKFASTNDLLMMNGVDHQPVQMNLTKAIRVANKLFPDYEFIHSNFEDYVKALKKDLPENLSTIKGELTSQDTDGWYTLANCASSRIYLKQENTKMERLLENHVEPIFLLNKEITEENQDKLDYAWHELLKNDPHDSISGSGVDAVHRGMMNRYAKVGEAGKSLLDASLTEFGQKVDTESLPKDSRPFLLINPSGVTRTEEKIVTIEVHRCLFAEKRPEQAYQDCEQYLKDHPSYNVFDSHGKPVKFRIIKKYTEFGYELPNRTFRIPYMASYVQIALSPELKPYSWRSFYLADAKQNHGVNSANFSSNILENKFVKAEVEPSGQINVYDANSDFKTRINLVDTGDIGNEYIYKQSADFKAITFDSKIKDLRIDQLIDGKRLSFKQTVELPESADSQLEYEQKAVVDVTQRQAKRSKNMKKFTVKVELTLMDSWKKLKLKISGDNQIRDHRLRMVFKTDLHTETHEADSIFEVVKRNNKVGKNWKNPENPQHEQTFVTIHDNQHGLVIGNFGLNEYEVDQEGSQISVTLLRCVGEMGDWGYFPTHDSQCLGNFEAQLSVCLTDGSPKEQIAAYEEAKETQIALLTKQLKWQSGTEKLDSQYLRVSNPAFAVTATYVLPNGKRLIRGYNLTDQDQALTVELFGQKAKAIVDLQGQVISNNVDQILKPAEIRTYEF